MKMRSLALAGTIMLATVTVEAAASVALFANGAAAQTQQQGAVNSNDQVATVHDQGAAKATHSDWFISPNDPRYQESGAPRAGEEPVFNTPYAPMHSGGPGGGGQG